MLHDTPTITVTDGIMTVITADEAFRITVGDDVDIRHFGGEAIAHEVVAITADEIVVRMSGEDDLAIAIADIEAIYG